MTHICLRILAVAIVAIWATGSAAAALCPTTSNTNSDCGYIVTIQPGGALTGMLVAGAAPYDGSDDALIGVINNSSAPVTSFTLSGSGNGGGIFGFDGDGICTFVMCTYLHPTGYEGPLNTFSNINANETFGEIDFTGTGLAAGASTYFSLEGSPQSIVLPLPPTPTGVPEPATIALLGGALTGLGALRRRMFV